jgi:hypothetical protein
MIFNSIWTFRLAINKAKYLDGLKFIGYISVVGILMLPCWTDCTCEINCCRSNDLYNLVVLWRWLRNSLKFWLRNSLCRNKIHDRTNRKIWLSPSSDKRRRVLINANKIWQVHITKYDNLHSNLREKLVSLKDQTEFCECWLSLNSEYFVFHYPISKFNDKYFAFIAPSLNVRIFCLPVPHL